MLQDLRRALRALGAHWRSTVVAVLSVGVGLGLNLTLFGVLHGLFLQERDVPERDRVLWLALVERDGTDTQVQPPPRSLLGVLAEGREWEGVGGWDGRLVAGTWIRSTTPGFLSLLGVTPSAGRFFQPEDTLAGAEPVAIVAYERALASWGSPGSAIGRQVQVGGTTRTVVGVLPPEWDPGEFPIHLPLGGSSAEPDRSRVRAFVRLRSAADRERATAEIELLVARVADTEGRVVGVRVGGEKEVLGDGGAARQSAPPFLLAATLLLAATVNLATVLLARGLARRRDLAVRRLLGAGRWPLLRPLLFESLVLAVIAGAVGVATAWGTFRTVLAFIPGPDAPRIGLPLLALAGALMAVVVLVGGCWPALVSGRVGAAEAIRAGSQSVVGQGPRVARAMRLALALQVAVAVPVVLVAGSFAARVVVAGTSQIGFDPTGLVHVQLAAGPDDDLDVRRVLDRAGEEPALSDVAATAVLPVTDPARVEVDRDGHGLAAAPPTRSFRLVGTTGDALGLFGVPVLAGRALSPAEAAAGAPVALVGETAARQLFGAGDGSGRPLHAALGRRLRVLGADGTAGTPWLTVVGVVGDVRDRPLFQEVPPPAVWVVTELPGSGATTVWARATGLGEPAAVRGLGAAVAAVGGPEAPRVEVTAAWVREQTAASRLTAWGTGLGAAFAVLLCLLGLYGVTALQVVSRRRELGVRSALGASAKGLVRTAFGGVAAAVAVGAVLGLAGWFVVQRLVLTHAPEVLGVAGAAALFLALLLVAAGGPASTAARVSPVAVLRSE